MNKSIKQHNIKLADEFTDGHFYSYGTLYKVDGDKSVIAWGLIGSNTTGSCIMTMATENLRDSIRISPVQREMIPITPDEYKQKLDEILNTIIL